MIRRISCIVLVILTRLACLAGRLSAGEPSPGHTGISPMPTMGGKQFWSDELFFHQWRIQRNVFTGHCRLLDGRDLRHAWGTYEECEAALDRIKQERRLPRMHGKAVVVLHGLFRSRAAMDSLCRYVEKKGGYQVFNVEYPSTQRDIGEIAKSLRHIIDHLDGIEEINFVGHSMGNIVIRHYFGDLERGNGVRPGSGISGPNQRPPQTDYPLIPQAGLTPPRFGRFVMLGPPNQGARLAQVLASNALFRQIAGEAGQELGVDWPRLEKRLATPAFEFGIVAGGRNGPKGYNPMLLSDNDGVVGVETAKLDGARDFVVVPVLHSFLPDDARVQQYTLHFLQHGRFVSARSTGVPPAGTHGQDGHATKQETPR
jgi:pimeloyl-ACP methyl ester carboxylesterase